MEEAIRLARMGKPLAAMLFIKSYVEDKIKDKDINSMDKVCKDLISAILATPSLNDESWRVFVPSPSVEEIEAVIKKLDECI
ncbi:hypothetical protein DFR86_03520 [Acidianus sulfidivorans JP7]|uniref:Uncharacterized protein n=1 Tax=Acidianus sulfidivorans JP7 TaxID=619593 RepID=A0A2U9IL23_9CREN|nr:hypothetical protein [Acidianus sulfidivorans]AWR96716.1 hypothetical protein DFR86_03520 [Acidianus sulfidivorans JP7]